jgi:hypothetical protein
MNDGRRGSGAGITFASNKASSSLKAYNNTIYTDKGALSFVWGQEWASLEVYNNIFYAYGNSGVINTYGNAPAIAMFSNNLYFTSGGAVTNFMSGGFIANPLFLAPAPPVTVGINGDLSALLQGYGVQECSPAVNAGKTIANPGSKDFFGNHIPHNQIDIGAHEYQTFQIPAVILYVAAQAKDLKIAVSAARLRQMQIVTSPSR